MKAFLFFAILISFSSVACTVSEIDTRLDNELGEASFRYSDDVEFKSFFEEAEIAFIGVNRKVIRDGYRDIYMYFQVVQLLKGNLPMHVQGLVHRNWCVGMSIHPKNVIDEPAKRGVPGYELGEEYLMLAKFEDSKLYFMHGMLLKDAIYLMQ